MKRSPFPVRQSSERPIARRKAEYAALRADSEYAFDHRVTESIFDIEDERAEVEIIVRGMIHGVN